MKLFFYKIHEINKFFEMILLQSFVKYKNLFRLGETPLKFKSNALTTRPSQLMISSNIN